MQKQGQLKESEKPDLRLFGSQINLCERPRVNSRNGVRSSSVCSRRPMSAVPAYGSQVSLSERLWRRPLSADSPYAPGELAWATHFSVSDRRDELVARSTTSSEAGSALDQGLESGFGATYALPSVLLLEDLTTEDFGRTWTEAPSARTELSEDQCRSEKSLGQRIITMARETSRKPSSGKKPPIPFPKPILTKSMPKKPPRDTSASRDSGVGSAAASGTGSKQSVASGNKSDISKSTDTDGTERDSCSSSSTSSVKSDAGSSGKRPGSPVPTRSCEAKSDEAVDNIINNIANRDLGKDVVGTEETALAAGEGVAGSAGTAGDPDHVVDLKFQRWFGVATGPPLSHRVWEAERRTDVLLEQLEAEEFLSVRHVAAPVSVDLVASHQHEQTAAEVPGSPLAFENGGDEDARDPASPAHRRNVTHVRTSPPSTDDQSWMATLDIPVHDVGTLCPGSEDGSGEDTAASATRAKPSSPGTDRPGCLRASRGGGDGAARDGTADDRRANPGEATSGIRAGALQDPDVRKLTAATVDPAIDSTYDDIVNVLKFMEQEETGTIMKLDRLTMSPQLDTISDTISTENDHKKTSPTSGKLKDILTFLDEVDQCCESAVNTAKNYLETPRDIGQVTPIKSSGLPRLDELLRLNVVDLAHQVLTLQLQLEERASSVGVLQDALAEQRQGALDADKEQRARMREQKRELEAVVARHQKFIDQLIADKKSLSEKCESLVAELRKAEERFGSTLRAVEERHSIELQRAKEMHAAAEKLRRERWIDSKTQKIKEMTVKGLEPELQRMAARHQQELADLRALHRQELEDTEARAARRAALAAEQMAVQRDEAAARDKEQLRQRLEKQLADEEQRLQELRRRLAADAQREKERLAHEAERQRQELEETRRGLAREGERALERARAEFREALETAGRRHQSELQLAKEAMEAQREAWALAFKKQQAGLLSEKEAELRDQLRRERDREIELVIERLESEAAHGRAELEQAADNRLRRLKEQHEAEVRDLEAAEAALKSKYSSAKQRLLECEDQLTGQQAQLRQLGKELQEARKIADRLSEERAAVKQVVEREMAGQLLTLQQEMARMREEAAEARVRAQLELAAREQDMSALATAKERDMQQVYHRVKLAVAKKDETFQQLKKQYEGALERSCHLEKMLEQQRRDFLLK
ncbi:centrosomal protein of 131 kDa-like [Bacillus rossius redtenbacheri]|uniref:centrosomal protein of 131 kDa-like n=1 Tax=Bacillus rossius redtenbacheri TaxID=93214 RepID=UPI002FDE4CCE